MKFFTRKRSLPAVPIISLIDILAILLIFFIATTTFKKRESLVKINLPKSSEIESTPEKTVRVVLALTGENEVFLGDQPVPIDQLAATLRDLNEREPDAKFEMNPDLEADVGVLFEIYDAARKAGVDIGKIPVRVLFKSEGGGD